MPRTIETTAFIPAARHDVWHALTTRTGATGAVCADANIALSVGGPFELLFDVDAPPGKQGSEGCRVLAWIDHEVLAVSWNNPPSLGALRDVEAFAVFTFADATDAGRAGTTVRVVHGGISDDPAFDDVIAYFTRAWGVFLFWLTHRFTVGPITDWANPPRPTG